MSFRLGAKTILNCQIYAIVAYLGVSIWDEEEMINKIICEKCGNEMHPIDQNTPYGMICPKCGWGWATTYIDPIQDDNQTYTVSLSKDNTVTIDAIKVVSRITGKIFPQARQIIEDSTVNIFAGKAVYVKNVLILLESQSLSYTVTPEFPYCLG